MGATILVTGVAGFLGQHVARHFLARGWRVLGFDVASPAAILLAGVEYYQTQLPGEALAQVLKAQFPAVCIHCAGCASVGSSMDEPLVDFRGNTALVCELLDTLRRNAPACRFVLLSSAAVYGDPASLPVTELHDVRPLSPYGYHKRQAELLCEEFARVYGLPTVSVRIFSAYGPGLRRQVVWDTCEKILRTGQLKLRGTGQESRDFIHATDIARALEIVAEKAPCRGEFYNLASGCEVTISELSYLLLKTFGSKMAPCFDGQPTPGNPLRWQADISKIVSLGFVPSISLEKGISEVASWARGELECRLDRAL
jgi:UDP-glucose 4-epimerase